MCWRLVGNFKQISRLKRSRSSSGVLKYCPHHLRWNKLDRRTKLFGIARCPAGSFTCLNSTWRTEWRSSGTVIFWLFYDIECHTLDPFVRRRDTVCTVQRSAFAFNPLSIPNSHSHVAAMSSTTCKTSNQLRMTSLRTKCTPPRGRKRCKWGPHILITSLSSILSCWVNYRNTCRNLVDSPDGVVLDFFLERIARGSEEPEVWTLNSGFYYDCLAFVAAITPTSVTKNVLPTSVLRKSSMSGDPPKVT